MKVVKRSEFCEKKEEKKLVTFRDLKPGDLVYSPWSKSTWIIAKRDMLGAWEHKYQRDNMDIVVPIFCLEDNTFGWCNSDTKIKGYTIVKATLVLEDE